jgi:hypothetical protein
MGSPMANGINAQQAYAAFGTSAPPRWWHDLKLMWAGASTIVLAALAIWNLGGSQMFTYNSRIAVVETKVASDEKVETVRREVGARMERIEDHVVRVEKKLDDVSERIIVKLDMLAAGQPARVEAQASAPAPATPVRAKKAAKKQKSIWETVTGAEKR